MALILFNHPKRVFIFCPYMKIALVAPFEEPVPPKKYGGTELVVSNVAEELVSRGHDVYLLASGDSITKAHLVPIVPQALRLNADMADFAKWRDYRKFEGIAKVIGHIRDINPDIVHNHLNWRLVMFSDLVAQPIMSTLHGPLSSIYEREAYTTYPRGNYVSISDNQRKALPDINWVKTVYNGIDTSKFDFSAGPGEYFVFLGRTTPEKGLAEICRMIKNTDHKLKIAAKVDLVDQEYFNSEIKPHIDGEQIEFLGEVDHDGKNKLLGKAKGLLLWLNWEEPFGLVVTEAMACGTPVIVNPRGSMQELIVDGKTGYLVGSIEEMQQKLDQVSEIDRAACRKHVEDHFTVQHMVDGYLELAERLTKT